MDINQRVDAETTAYVQRLANITREPNGYVIATLAIIAIIRFAKNKHGKLPAGVLRDIEAVILKSAGA